MIIAMTLNKAVDIFYASTYKYINNKTQRPINTQQIVGILLTSY